MKRSQLAFEDTHPAGAEPDGWEFAPVDPVAHRLGVELEPLGNLSNS